MENDNVVKVEWDVENNWVDVAPCFELVSSIKKPYLININQVECAVGEWNKDKSKYGLRVFFASGNSVWFEGDSGREVFRSLAFQGSGGSRPAWMAEKAEKKYDEARR